MTHASAITVDERSAAASALTGLTSAEARRRLVEIGPNAVSEHVAQRWKVFVAILGSDSLGRPEAIRFWASSVIDIGIVLTLALSGTLMERLAARVITGIFVAAIGFAFILDRIKLRLMTVFKVK